MLSVRQQPLPAREAHTPSGRGVSAAGADARPLTSTRRVSSRSLSAPSASFFVPSSALSVPSPDVSVTPQDVSTPLFWGLTLPVYMNMSPRARVALEASCVTFAVTKAAVTASLFGLPPAAIAAVVAVNLAIDVGFMVLTHEMPVVQRTLISMPPWVATVLFLSWISATPFLETFATAAVTLGLLLGVGAAGVGLIFLGHRVMLFFIARQLDAAERGFVSAPSAGDGPAGAELLVAEATFTPAFPIPPCAPLSGSCAFPLSSQIA